MNELCTVCEGLGYLNKDEQTEIPDICPKCYGKGKLDWIEQIIGAKHPLGTILHRGTILNIQKNIERIISDHVFELNDPKSTTDIYYKIESFLSVNKIKRIIYAWQINLLSDVCLCIHPDYPKNHILKTIDVNFQLDRTVKFINLKFTVTYYLMKDMKCQLYVRFIKIR